MDTIDLLQNIWVEKYRPTTLDDCILESRLRQKLASIKKLSHFIFYGSYGMGKTSVARILAKKFGADDVLQINAADEKGIDVVRSKIHEFMQYQSLAEYKVIILNEASYLTKPAQEALRSALEDYSENCRFIFTANDLNAIDNAIQSRCQRFEFVPPPIGDVAKRIWAIGKKEGIDLTEDDKPNLVKLIKMNYPDIRQTINEFEKCCLSGSFVWEAADNWFEELYQKIEKKVPHREIREWFIKTHFNRAMSFTPLYQYLFEKFSTNDSMVLLIANYMNMQVVDTEINFAAFLIEAERILVNA